MHLSAKSAHLSYSEDKILQITSLYITCTQNSAQVIFCHTTTMFKTRPIYGLDAVGIVRLYNEHTLLASLHFMVGLAWLWGNIRLYTYWLVWQGFTIVGLAWLQGKY